MACWRSFRRRGSTASGCTRCCGRWPPVQTFPEFGAGHERRLESLRQLVGRAKRWGIDVYLYVNEPRAMPEEFFHGRPDLKGVREGDHAALCTSRPEVRRWLTESLAYVFQRVPDLGGVFTITASENLTNCASHGGQTAVPALQGPLGGGDHCRGQRGDRERAYIGATRRPK